MATSPETPSTGDKMTKDRYRVFEPVARSIRFAESANAGCPIFAYAPTVPGAAAYRALAKEIDQ